MTHNPKISWWRYFRLITWPNITWRYLGGRWWYIAKSYWHLNIKNRPALWPDASQDGCTEPYCMHCGKGNK